MSEFFEPLFKYEIGNCIRWGSEQRPAKVVSVQVNLNIIDEKGNRHTGDLQVQPIELVRETIARAGFKPLDDRHFEKGNYILRFKTHRLDEGVLYKFGDESIFYKVNYLHELQNAYRALADDELEVNWLQLGLDCEI